jgi:hypothetical protein
MGDMEIRVRWSGYGRSGKRHVVAALVVLMLGSAVFLSTTDLTKAQVALDAFFPGGLTGNGVCVAGERELQISADDTCDNTLNPVTGLRIGPAGSQTTFDGSNGNATFGGNVDFNGPTGVAFHTNATFHNGISATTATFTGTVTMNGGLAVASGQTVDMGGNRVQNVGAPVAGTDAANKNYVDVLHDFQQSQINNIVGVNNQQNARLTSVETVNAQQDARLAVLENGFANQADQIAAINQSIRGLANRDRELADGVAISLALAQPMFQPGQTFAMRVGWGNFDGSNALGVSAAGLLAKFNNGNTVVLDLGFGGGARTNVYAGRAGLTFGW